MHWLHIGSFEMIESITWYIVHHMNTPTSFNFVAPPPPSLPRKNYEEKGQICIYTFFLIDMPYI